MKTGIVTFYNADKGFGFIRPDDRSADQFVHLSGLIDADELKVGQRVTFTIGFDQRRGKEKAVDVKIA